MGEKQKSNALQTLGKNIKKFRLLKGFSQENLACELQKSINFVSLLENGKTGLSIHTIVELCKVLEIDANSLFTGIIPANTSTPDTFILNALSIFDEQDKAIVVDMITYIFNSKT